MMLSFPTSARPPGALVGLGGTAGLGRVRSGTAGGRVEVRGASPSA